MFGKLLRNDLCLLQLRHKHALELIQPDHAYEHVRIAAKLVDALRLDPHVIRAQVEADLHQILILILLRHRKSRHRVLVAARRGSWRVEEILHVLDKRHRLERVSIETVHIGEERLLIVPTHLLQALELLAVELLNIWRGRCCDRWRHGPPQVCDRLIAEGIGELKLSDGIGECEVDSRLHFDRRTRTFCEVYKSVFRAFS